MAEHVEVAGLCVPTHFQAELLITGNEYGRVPQAGHFRQRHTRTGPLELSRVDIHLLEDRRGVYSVVPLQRFADEPGNVCQCRGFVEHGC